MQSTSGPVTTVDSIDVTKVAEEFELDNEFTWVKDAKITGKSGAVHKFDLVVTSKKDENIKIAVLHGISSDLVNEIMKFNATASDCGVQLKALVVSKDLDNTENNLTHMYNIVTIDQRQKHKPKSYIFGVEGIDKRLSGTMRKGSVYMISGESGVGKTTSCIHFLINAARNHQKSAIILTDTRPAEFISNAGSFSFGFESYYKNGMIEVLELSDQIREMKYEILSNRKEERKFITKITTEIRKFVVANSITRLVIDPITPALVGEDDFINVLLNGLAIPNVITIITSNVKATDVSFFGIEEYYVSGILKLEFADASYATRRMSIVKMRGGSYDFSPFNYKVTSEGIVRAEEIVVNDSGGGPALKSFRDLA